MFGISYEEVLKEDGSRYLAISDDDLANFRPNPRRAPETTTEDSVLDAVVAVFDLEGFSAFCSQPDFHLIVPKFVVEFADWLFQELLAEFTRERLDAKRLLWARLPEFWKFTGDGGLFLWRLEGALPDRLLTTGNIVVPCHKVVQQYEGWRREIVNRYADPPAALRCGIARGNVTRLDEYDDYVGTCLNVASRLQKVKTLTFACQEKGISPAKIFKGVWEDVYTVKKWKIRGNYRNELIVVDKTEFEALCPKDQADFLDP